jgi:hypothetical protein
MSNSSASGTCYYNCRHHQNVIKLQITSSFDNIIVLNVYIAVISCELFTNKHIIKDIEGTYIL